MVIDWGCLRTGFWEEYLNLREMMWRDNGGSCTVRSLIIYIHPQILLGRSSQGEWGGGGMWHGWGRREKCRASWWESPKERDHSEGHGVDGRMGSKLIGEICWGMWIGFDWLRTTIGGELLWMRWWTLGFWRHGVGHGRTVQWSVNFQYPGGIFNEISVPKCV
jgi:hypothetical protein